MLRTHAHIHQYEQHTCIRDQDPSIFNAFRTIGSNGLIKNETCECGQTLSNNSKKKKYNTDLRQDMNLSAFRRLF